MAGYVKIWTTIFNDEDFLALTIGQRGLFLQLIVECKRQADNGHVLFTSCSHAAHAFVMDRASLVRALFTLDSRGLCRLDKSVDNQLCIFIPNYVYWQTVTVKQMNIDIRKREKKLCQKSPIREDKIREDKSILAKKSPPFPDIKKDWNRICKSLPQIIEMAGARRKRIEILWKDHSDSSWWTDLFRRIESSGFLTGQNDRSWRADFDWCLKPANLTKILEGNYDGEKKRPERTPLSVV